jgi:myo-inositol-1-phosphate synthase
VRPSPHHVLAKLFEDRGVRLERTYQLNVGGNIDFQNMLERSRLHSKKITKTQAVTSQIPPELRDADAHIGPSDYVPFLADRRHARVQLEGRGFGDVPVHLEYEVWDSPKLGPASSSTRSGPARSPRTAAWEVR